MWTYQPETSREDDCIWTAHIAVRGADNMVAHSAPAKTAAEAWAALDKGGV